MHCYKSPVNAVKKGEWSSTEYTNACHCCNVRISLHCDALDNRLINIISNIIIVYIFARMSTNREERGNPLRILEENIIYHNKTHALHLPIEQWEYYPLGINFYLILFNWLDPWLRGEDSKICTNFRKWRKCPKHVLLPTKDCFLSYLLPR